jgi:tRNA(Arg) A34 adenosine deaminase TadA
MLEMHLAPLKQLLEAYRIRSQYGDDSLSLEVCKLALSAVERGNYGIGSLLVDSEHMVIASGENMVFKPYFRSDLHAEMVVMNSYEDAHKDVTSLNNYTLYTSLEPCPMCTARLISSGCQRVVYVANDLEGGMAHRVKLLPSTWVQLARQCRFTMADCSPVLKDVAYRIFRLNSEELNDMLAARSKA